MKRGSAGSSLTQSVGLALASAAISAAATYFLDPRSGGRRRALVRDQFVHAGRLSREFAAKAGRDALHRGYGVYAGAATPFRHHDMDDAVVEQRARTELGRLTGHPGAIGLRCSDGVLTVSGHVLTAEVAGVLAGLARVLGVKTLVNNLNVHDQPGNIPSLQGQRHDHLPGRFEYRQDNWAPAPRMLAGSAAFTAIGVGLAARNPLGLLSATAGAALLMRTLFNRPLSRLLGLRGGAADGVTVQKTIEVQAEPNEAYACWRDLENLPRFMSHVREIRRLDENRYRWIVDAIAGVPVEWDARVTEDVPGELLAWRTEDHSTVQSSGVVRFEASPYGATRVHVRMTYRPPGNAVGHAIARLFHRDARHQMHDDLLRFKAYVEGRGRQRGDSAPRAGEEQSVH